MKTSHANQDDLSLLRERLLNIHPGSAHQAQNAPNIGDIFTPSNHANALDPQRALVVGNRGVGKSFWSAVLTHDQTRNAVAENYPRLQLNRIQAVLGFHEAAGKDDGPAPSPSLLADLLRQDWLPEDIWYGVLLRAVGSKLNAAMPSKLKDILEWRKADIERAESVMRHADQQYYANGKIFLLVFDALDRMARDWGTITPLTEGVLKLALDMRGYRAMKAKVFMRTDQSNDGNVFRFADASKLRAEAVKLVWKREELFGLMYQILTKNDLSCSALARLAGVSNPSILAADLADDFELQERLFYRIAGEFMGAGSKRGRTYTWIVDHLADAFGDTSPRSFLTALQKAAASRPEPRDSVIDHNGIRTGVQDASRVRLDELQEDYSWISEVIGALEGLEVPCEPKSFTQRWKERTTIETIRDKANTIKTLLPLELETSGITPETALLYSLKSIGVIEFRDEKRINVPDIFRVEARIKRRGGVRPPSAKRK